MSKSLLGYSKEEMNMSEDKKKSETFTFEYGKMDHILSDLASLLLHFKDLQDKNTIQEDIIDRINTIYEHLLSAVVTSRLDNNKIGRQ
jgi:hypothetical protein